MRTFTFTVLLSGFALTLLQGTVALTYRGADITSVPQVESSGKSYVDGGQRKNFENIIASKGANTARIRIWTAGANDLNYGLNYAKRVKQAGLTLIVDLHYSDTWADPGKQAIPSSWPRDLSGLNTKIYEYTLDVINKFKNQGTPIDVLQIGNEINDGLLWPVGQISKNGFNPASQLLHSAASAGRQAKVPKLMVHLANGWDSGGQAWWWKGIQYQGAFSLSDVDLVGVSFYPFYDTKATLSNLKSSLTALIGQINKDIMVAETDWPQACSGGPTLSEKAPGVGVSGQQMWISSIKNVLTALPNGRGVGILYWEPGWIGNANLGSGCSDNLLVDSNGNTRASIDIFNRM